jgi:hypothetical protein
VEIYVTIAITVIASIIAALILQIAIRAEKRGSNVKVIYRWPWFIKLEIDGKQQRNPEEE